MSPLLKSTQSYFYHFSPHGGNTFFFLIAIWCNSCSFYFPCFWQSNSKVPKSLINWFTSALSALFSTDFCFCSVYYNRVAASNPPPVFDVITGMTGLPYDDSLWQVSLVELSCEDPKICLLFWKRHSDSGDIICNNVQVFSFSFNLSKAIPTSWNLLQWFLLKITRFGLHWVVEAVCKTVKFVKLAI